MTTEQEPTDVLPELVEIMYTSKKSIATVGAALTATCAAIYALHGDPIVAAAGALSLVVVVGRVLNSTAYHQAASTVTTSQLARVWEIRYAVGGAAFALVVGLFCAHIIRTGTPTSQLLAATVMLAYPTGMIARVAVRPAIARLHLALAFLPAIAAAASMGTPEHWMLALLFVVYLIAGVEIIGHLARTIVDRVHLHREVARRASHDDLTGLPNRAHFRIRLIEAQGRLDRYGTRFAVHAFDLDRFKAVNDTLGHAVGDRVLQEVAERVLNTARSTDVIGRLGGDEFAILQFPVIGLNEATTLADRVVNAVSRPLVIDGQLIDIGVSVGTTICEAPDTIDEIMRQADMALYAAKAAGRGRSEIYIRS